MRSPSDRAPLLDRGFSFIHRRAASDRLLLHLVILVLLGSFLYGVVLLAQSFSSETAISGGGFSEGIVGTPRFVNPVLATTRADKDLTTLIYRGLMKVNTDGELVPDLAESVTVSKDGRTYTITLKEDLSFHDGTPLRARDVSYTIGLIQNPDLKSPLQSDWFGVLVEEVSERKLKLVLEEAYAPFMENLTVGILPQDQWDNIPIEQLPFSQHNTEPIGAGPYRVTEIERDQAGLISAYHLRAFTEYDPTPKFERVTVRFYRNEGELFSALEDGEVSNTPSLGNDQLASLPSSFRVLEYPLPRTFALFLNQNRSPALRDAAAREALHVAIDRPALVRDVLGGHGNTTASPIPPGFFRTPATTSEQTGSSSIKRAQTILRDGGWSRSSEGTWQKVIGEDTVPLSLTITTANSAVFDATAEAIAQDWQALGADVGVAQYAQGDLVQAIVRPRDFSVLLFGADVGRQVDLYAFWHSSQKDDPGLNIAQYTNISADGLLEDLQTTIEPDRRQRILSEAAQLITAEHPAIFLFSPSLAYVTTEALTITPVSQIGDPSDRFMNVSQWYSETSPVWPIFTDT